MPSANECIKIIDDIEVYFYRYWLKHIRTKWVFETIYISLYNINAIIKSCKYNFLIYANANSMVWSLKKSFLFYSSPYSDKILVH